MNYIACFGDSLVQGFPYSNNNSWIAEAEKHAEIKMLNYGVCGDCCDDILTRLKMTSLPEYVKHILFFGGANDIIQGRPEKHILEDYAKLVKWCEEKNYSLCIVLPLISAEPMLNVQLQSLGRAVYEKYSDKVFMLDLQPAVGMSSLERRLAYLDSVHPKATTYKNMGKYAAPLVSEWASKEVVQEVEEAEEVIEEYYEDIASCLLETPVGNLRISASDKGIVEIAFTDEDVTAFYANDNKFLAEASKQLKEYFAKERTTFDLPLDVAGTEYQVSVWNELQKIPYGEVRTYQDIATALGNPKASRSVGMANNRNPICIVVPCHRVVGKGNKVTGYAAGVDKKEYLLKLEGVEL